MKAIFTAHLNTIGTTDMNGNNCEWAWTESSEEEYGREWDGDVAGYVANLELEDGYEVIDEYDGAIHNLPEGAIVVAYNGEPCEIYWAAEEEEE